MKIRWLKAWIIQFAIMLAACLLAELSYYVSSLLRDIILWAGIPLLGAVTAARCVLGGLNNYLAWIAPPVCSAGASLLLWGYVPKAGPVLMCAFVSLVGAAAGEVLKENKKHMK
ncbi:MAG: hypothetical protein IKM02_06745 [Clostridia bacterium]|nr:hypothetical protein [Clostridia bacterium]